MARDCRELVVLGCRAPNPMASNHACAQRSDGAIFLGSSSLFPEPDFGLCDDAIRERALFAQFCDASSDAGNP